VLQAICCASALSSGISSIEAGKQQQALLHQDESKGQETDQDLHPPARKRAVESDLSLDETLYENSDQGSSYKPRSARQQRSADNHRRNGIVFDADGRQ
jgi:hypothetical protein